MGWTIGAASILWVLIYKLTLSTSPPFDQAVSCIENIGQNLRYSCHSEIMVLVMLEVGSPSGIDRLGYQGLCPFTWPFCIWGLGIGRSFVWLSVATHMPIKFLKEPSTSRKLLDDQKQNNTQSLEVSLKAWYPRPKQM